MKMKKIILTFMSLALVSSFIIPNSFMVFSPNTDAVIDGVENQILDQNAPLTMDDYDDLKAEYDLAVKNNDQARQEELIKLGDQLLENHMNDLDSQAKPRFFAADSYSLYFSSGQWINRNGVISLSMTPIFGYHWQDASSYDLSWNALYNRHVYSSYWQNTSSMRKQYICHVNSAGGWKTPWNLEPSKTNVNPFTCN